jgi:hypothetical protein
MSGSVAGLFIHAAPGISGARIVRRPFLKPPRKIKPTRQGDHTPVSTKYPKSVVLTSGGVPSAVI